MTNQVNQAFEKWWYGTDANLILCSRNSANAGYQAAAKASESEINSLKERVEELQADNERLREAFQKSLVTLEQANIAGMLTDTILVGDTETLFDYMGEAISSTPEQSLAERKEEYECKLMSQCTDPNL